MRILVLGGTAPLGREVALAAHERGHEVTCLARGEAGDTPPGVTLVRADREQAKAYDPVAATDWDEVVDVSRQPGQVRSAVAALADRAAHWSFVSTCSVYARTDVVGDDESAPLLEPLPVEQATADAESYGPGKVGCELAVQAALGSRALLARAGLLVGPADRSDRFGYWPARFARGGPVLVPAGVGQHCQVLDFRDLAQFLVDAAERGVAGPLDLVGEARPLPQTLADVSEVVAQDVDRDAAPVVVDDDWLVGHEVEPWAGPESLPLWLPEPGMTGFMARSGVAARAAGLRQRPFVETVRDTLAEERSRGLDRDRKAGLSPRRETELLSAWG